MEPITLYSLIAVIFVLGLAAIGGATFGRQRNRRAMLAVAGLLLWTASLAACNQVTPTPAPTATATAVAAATATDVPAAKPTPTMPVSPLETADTAEPEPTAAPADLPDLPGRIAFHSDQNGDLDIYAINADGSDLQRLTDSPGRDFEPDWSPDGTTIVFSSDRDDPDNAQLYLMDADGGNQRTLMPYVPADFLAARWSPDGEWILFHSNQEVDGIPWFNIYKVRKDGTELTDLTNSVDNSFRPDWSPDGQRVVFMSERDGNRQLYVMNADGSNPVRLTESFFDDNRPRWSPDDSSIMFESNREGANLALYLMDAPQKDASGPDEESIRLLSFPGFNSQSAAWADGGKMIVFSADRELSSHNLPNWDVYMMSADASAIYRLTTGDRLDRFPTWTARSSQ